MDTFRLPLGTIGHRVDEMDTLDLAAIAKGFFLLLSKETPENVCFSTITDADACVTMTWYNDNDLRKQKTFYFELLANPE